MKFRQYTLLVPQPTKAKVFPSQCMSIVSEGQTMTFLSNQAEPGAFTATVIMNATATAFGIPVNGFNLAVATMTSAGFSSSQNAVPVTSEPNLPVSTSSSTPLSTPQSASKATTSSPGLSPGALAGIAIAAVLVVILSLALFYMRWNRRNITKSLPSPGSPPMYQKAELPNTIAPQEFPQYGSKDDSILTLSTLR